MSKCQLSGAEDSGTNSAEETPVRKASGKIASGAAKKPVPSTENDKQQEAFDLVVETVEALVAECGEEEKMWASMVKQTHKLLALTRADKGDYIVRLPGPDQ